MSMYNPEHAVYPRTVSGCYSSTERKGNRCLPELWPRPQTADSAGPFFYTRTDTTAATATSLFATTATATSAPTGSCVRQLFRALCYDDVLQLRINRTLQRTHVRHRSNCRSATTGSSTVLIWKHLHRFRRKPKVCKRLWLIRARRSALSMGYANP